MQSLKNSVYKFTEDEILFWDDYAKRAVLYYPDNKDRPRSLREKMKDIMHGKLAEVAASKILSNWFEVSPISSEINTKDNTGDGGVDFYVETSFGRVSWDIKSVIGEHKSQRIVKQLAADMYAFMKMNDSLTECRYIGAIPKREVLKYRKWNPLGFYYVSEYVFQGYDNAIIF